ncbi:helicase [Cryptotrichosporon argae]
MDYDPLADIVAEVDAAEALDLDFANDVAANSMSDDSDLDEPKALPAPRAPIHALRQQQPAYPSVNAGPSYRAGSGPQRARAPVTPSTRAPMTPTPRAQVQASAGRGGRVVYGVSRPGAEAAFFIAQWRKPQMKKHSTCAAPCGTWDGDAYLKIEGSRVTMISEGGDKNLGTSALTGGLPTPGTELRIGQYECEVDCAITEEQFRKSTSCLNGAAGGKPAPGIVPVGHSPTPHAPARSSFKAPLQAQRPKFGAPFLPPRAAVPIASLHAPESDRPQPVAESSAAPERRAIDISQFYAKPQARKINIGEKSSKDRHKWGGALHDPFAPDAVVLQRPDDEEAKRVGQEVNDVVVDPMLGQRLREHQKDGVKFMYRCIMGYTGSNAEGCILADEMGLGKTLQTITLIHTLLKQSPWASKKSIISKAVIVCPVTLVKNWANEFKKWCPRDIGVLAVASADVNLTPFTFNNTKQVLIIGYERQNFGSIIKTLKRIILTGTPVQNDLGEFWSLANFACPGVFGTYPAFKKQYETPILRAREPKCPFAEVENGKMRSDELRNLTSEFVLRRTNEVMENFLPPKHEYVVFVAPTQLQLDVYDRLFSNSDVKAVLGGDKPTNCLAMIGLLRKVANSPTLLRKKDKDEEKADSVTSVISTALHALPQGLRTHDASISGKLSVLQRMLACVQQSGHEKIVVVSSWTTTLDIIETMCRKMRYPLLRLDGDTKAKDRQPFIDQFNRGSRDSSMVFLLSAKAGGAGVNLIGANRLVLFDSDWNPSTDLQAMARIHRDGQKKPVYIYRLLTTNTIDEKIYQRQLTKTGLSNQMLERGETKKGGKDSFTLAELKDIFSINLHTDGCGTHDLLGCQCLTADYKQRVLDDGAEIKQQDGSSDDEQRKGFLSASQYDPKPTPKMIRKAAVDQAAKLASLKDWTHHDTFDPISFRDLADDLLLHILTKDYKPSRDAKSVTGASTPTTVCSDLPSPSMANVSLGDETGDGGDSDEDDANDVDSEAAGRRANGNSSAREESDADDSDTLQPSAAAGKRKRALEHKSRSSRSAKSSRVASEASRPNSDDGAGMDLDVKVPKAKGDKRKSKHASRMLDLDVKRHNLRDMAESGQGGRVTMVFEKVSKAEL